LFITIIKALERRKFRGWTLKYYIGNWKGIKHKKIDSEVTQENKWIECLQAAIKEQKNQQ
jgi:hypothetical protein